MAPPLTLGRLRIPADADDYGWLSLHFNKNRGLRPPTGLEVVMGGRQDGLSFPLNSPQLYLQQGVAAIQRPTGIPTGDFLPSNQWGAFSGRAFFNDINGNKLWSDYTEEDTRRAATNWLTGRARFNTFDTKEDYSGHGMFEENNPVQFKLFWELIGEATEARGDICGTDYDGPFLYNNVRGDSDFINALSSPAAALAYNANHDYFRLRQYEHGIHPVVNAYFRGENNYQERNFEFTAQLAHAKMAMAESGATALGKKLIYYTQNVVNEFAYTAENCFFDVDGGGEFRSHQAQTIAFGEMLFYYNIAAQDCGVMWEFSDPQLNGSDRSIIRPDYPSGYQHFEQLGSNNNPRRTEPRLWYESPRTGGRGEFGGSCPSESYGYSDTMPLGVNIAGSQYRWTGTREFKYPTLHIGSQTFTPGPGHSFLQTIRTQMLPYVRAYRNPSTGKGWVMWYYTGGRTPITDAVLTIDNVDIPINISSKIKAIRPGQPEWWFFTSTIA